MSDDDFERLIAEAERAGFQGWDWTWLDGRRIEQPPPWSYRDRVLALAADARSMLDMGTGGGEFLASLDRLPPDTWASEGYEPNIPIAQNRLQPLGVRVVGFVDPNRLPLPDAAFDLIINRHEEYHPDDVRRMLKPGGTFLTQQVGGANENDLNQALGAPPYSEDQYAHWTLEYAVDQLQRAGFTIVDQRAAFPPVVFRDISAVIYYLRAAPWQIADFSVARYRDRLLDLHRRIQAEGSATFHSDRFMIEARAP